MDLFILDDQLRRQYVVDQFESLIWTDRYKDSGDFELLVKADRGTVALLPPGTRLAIAKSYSVATVETVEKTVSNEGVAQLKLKGRSLENTLDDRAGIPSMASGSTATPKWVLTGLPAAIARTIFQTICVDLVNSPNDVIPFYHSGSMFTPGTIPEPSTSITISLDFDSVFNLIKKICDVYNLGFRLTRKELPNGAASELYFQVYTGDDRTTLQTTFPAVVFSPELDNLSDTNEITSTALLKNVAYVVAPNGTRMVYANGYDASTATGFNRKAITVMADDITLAAGTPLQNALEQRGQEELAKWRVVIAFDGEIPQFGSYKYGVDYDLGDLVEMRNSDGLATNMRVTEQIFVSDATGERSYPTLETELLITAGSWYAWDAGEFWDDADGYWADA